MPLAIRLAVEYLKGGDLVLVLLDELAKALDLGPCLLLGVFIVTGREDLVDVCLVDDLLVLGLDLLEGPSQLGVVEEVTGPLDELPRRLLYLGRRRALGFEDQLGLRLLGIGVHGVQEPVCHLLNCVAL